LDDNLARAVAYSSRNAIMELHNTFRVNAVKFDWDINSGIAVAFDFHNYVMPRNSVQPTPTALPVAPPGREGKAAGGNRKK